MNIVFIMTDRHNPEFTGCYGNELTRTPNIDGLAERGTRFQSAYCLSPLCVPSRAAIMSGRFVHEIGTWDNAFPYTGNPAGWGHCFSEQGICLTTIGKLDFLPEADDGVEDERLTNHRDSLDIHSLFREDGIQPRYQHLQRLRGVGPDEDDGVFRKDVEVIDEARKWLIQERPADRPWILIVNIKQPHPPWNPPQDIWDYYDPLVRFEDLDARYTEDPSRLHPYHQDYSQYTCSDLATDEEIRRGIVGYHGTCEMADRSVGRVLDAIDEAGLQEETLTVYSSDHGGSVGAHVNSGMGSMYEDSIRVPLIVAGPGIRSGTVEAVPVSHHDLFQTFGEALGMPQQTDKRGVSLIGLLEGNEQCVSSAFALCEYHGAGLPSSVFAVRWASYKYVACVGERPMLFDLDHDPLEMHDLVLERPDDPSVKETIDRMQGLLEEVCSPGAVDARAKADQLDLRDSLEKSGRLGDELWKRGYERRTDRLVARADMLP